MTATTQRDTVLKDTRRFDRVLAAVLMPIGPAAVAVLRFIYPYGPVGDESARDPAVYQVILWLSLVAVFTLVPGVYAAVRLVRRYSPRLTAWVAGLLIPAYLSLGALGLTDAVGLVGDRTGLDPKTTNALADQLGALPTVNIYFAAFILGHIVGTVLLGILCFRARLMPRGIAVLLAVSQPLHLTADLLQNHWLDLFAWGLTAVGMVFLARRVLRTPNDAWELPAL